MLLDTSQFGFVKRRPRSKILSVRDYLLVAHYAPMHRTTFRRSVPFMNTFCEGWTQDSNGIMISWLHCTSHPVTHWRIQTTGRDDKHGGEGDHYRGTGGGSEHYGRAAGAGVYTWSATVTNLALCRKKKKPGGPKLMPDKKKLKRIFLNCRLRRNRKIHDQMLAKQTFWWTGSPVQYVMRFGPIPGSQRILSKLIKIIK
nr:uncharacterized protein LOC129416401 isoform X2 [Misgurnus anguillicaudatus]